MKIISEIALFASEVCLIIWWCSFVGNRSLVKYGARLKVSCVFFAITYPGVFLIIGIYIFLRK